jgi:hypothetical protein
MGQDKFYRYKGGLEMGQGKGRGRELDGTKQREGTTLSTNPLCNFTEEKRSLKCLRRKKEAYTKNV